VPLGDIFQRSGKVGGILIDYSVVIVTRAIWNLHARAVFSTREVGLE
jgi:hypothetical protein